MRWPWYVILAGIAAVLVVVARWRALSAKRAHCRRAWRQLDAQLRRRHDLARHLVEKSPDEGPAKDLRRAIGEARSAEGVGPTARSEQAVSEAIRALLAEHRRTRETAPSSGRADLRALREELISAENRIAFCREQYNDRVAAYNIALTTFANRVLARILHLQPERPFSLDDADRPPLSAAGRQAE